MNVTLELQKNEARAPSVDLLYWAMMLSACSMGEAIADFMSHGPLGLGYGWASVVLMTGVIAALFAERAAKSKSQARYWIAIVIMSTAGTTLADFLSRTLKLGYFWGTALLAALFAATFFLWRRSLHPAADLEKQKKAVPKTDSRYWAAIMVASTLGTTLGDSLTNGTKLGFGGGSAILLSLLGVVLFLESRARAENEARYWTALVLTSTVGATSGDYITKEEGLNLGYYWGIGAVLLLFVDIFIFARSRRAR